MSRPTTLAAVATTRLEGQPLAAALAEFLDVFYPRLANGDADALIAAEPPALPDPIEHALLGAVAEHLARRWQLPIPAWTDNPSRFLDRPYFTTPLEDLKALLIAESPLAFRRRLIFTEAEPLRRARWPADRPTP